MGSRAACFVARIIHSGDDNGIFAVAQFTIADLNVMHVIPLCRLFLVRLLLIRLSFCCLGQRIAFFRHLAAI